MLKRLIALAFLSAAPLVRAEREVSLGDYSREARNVILERVRGALAESGAEAMVVGTVTYAGDDNLFIQMADDGLKVVFADGAARKCRGAAAGDTVEIVGRPALEGGRVVFLASAVRKTGTAALPKPVVADASALTRVGDGKDDVNWLVVEVTGRAIGLTENVTVPLMIAVLPELWKPVSQEIVTPSAIVAWLLEKPRKSAPVPEILALAPISP